MATPSGILAWRIPWTEELGELQSMGLQSLTQLKDFHFTLYIYIYILSTPLKNYKYFYMYMYVCVCVYIYIHTQKL